jgi:hypothetical protein
MADYCERSGLWMIEAPIFYLAYDIATKNAQRTSSIRQAEEDEGARDNNGGSVTGPRREAVHQFRKPDLVQLGA